jgi:preprotein translocase subunit SecF
MKNNTNPAQPVEEKKVIPFMKWKWWFIGSTTLLALISIFYMVVNGFNFGVDFKGGVKLVYKFDKVVSDGELRQTLEPLKLGDIQVVQFGKPQDNSFLIKVKFHEGRNVTSEIQQKLDTTYGAGKVILLSEENVGPKVGNELKNRGTLAMIFTWVLILVYVGVRFDFLFAPGGIIALIHDTIITMGFFVFFGKEFNLPILAAILTLIGYSINDTIIVYDRIRENLKKYPASMPLEEVVNRSMSQTFSRTIITSLTVLFVVVVLFIFGGAVIHDFAFCMVIGVIIGTYSSIFVATPIYLGMQHFFPHKGIQRGGRRR